MGLTDEIKNYIINNYKFFVFITVLIVVYYIVYFLVFGFKMSNIFKLIKIFNIFSFSKYFFNTFEKNINNKSLTSKEDNILDYDDDIDSVIKELEDQASIIEHKSSLDNLLEDIGISNDEDDDN